MHREEGGECRRAILSVTNAKTIWEKRGKGHMIYSFPSQNSILQNNSMTGTKNTGKASARVFSDA